MKKKTKPLLFEKPLFIEGINVFYLVSLVVLLALITFYSGIKNAYTNFDDTIIVFGNPLVTQFSFYNFNKVFTTFTNGMYHPITTIFLAMEYSVFAESAKGFHAVSLGLHICNSVLVFWLIYLIKPIKTVAFIAALLFALHPMHAESVYWISERKGLLCALFLLSGLISYIFYLRSRKNKNYLFSLLFFLLAVLSKPSGIVFPALIILLDFYFLRKINIINKIPFIIVSLIVVIVSIYAANSVEGINSFADYTLLDRLVLVMYAPFLYVFKAIVPYALSAKYFFPDKSEGLLPLVNMAGAVLFMLLLVVLFKFRKKSKELNFGILFFLISVSVYLPLISIGDSIISERHSYIPYLGLFFIASYFFNIAISKFRNQKHVFWLLLIIILVSMGVASNQRSKTWANSVSLWADVVKTNPGSALAYVNLGDSYTELEKYDIAETNYTKAISLDSLYAPAYMNRGYVRLKTEAFVPALQDMNKAVSLNPGFSKVFYNRSCLFIETSQWQNAIDDCNKAIQLNPAFGLSYYNRAVAYYNINRFKEALTDIDKSIALQSESALLLLNKGKIQIALADTLSAQIAFSKAEELSPDNADYSFQIGMAYFKSKHFIASDKYFSKTIDISPSFTKAFFYRAMSRESLSMNDEALADYNLCIRGDSTFAPAFYGKGLLLIKTGNNEDVCKSFKVALKLGFEAARSMTEKYCK